MAAILTGNLFQQVKATMLVTVFVFIGIEGASVYSRYAKKRSDVGAATIAGFIGVTGLMVLVTLTPYAVLHRADIAGMRQPSMAAVLEAVVGHWGAVFVSLGLLVSVLGAYLAWSLICAEVLFAAAKNKDMPKIFATENANRVPAAALWMTNIVVQLIVISTYWSRDAFALMLNLTSAMSLIPYLFVAAYGFKLSKRGESYETQPEGSPARFDHRFSRGGLYGFHDLRRRHEVHRAFGDPLRARDAALHLGAARTKCQGLQDRGHGHLRRCNHRCLGRCLRAHKWTY